jgi:hypothetical protein
MAKLRNYEIDAIYNIICKRITDLKEAKIAEIKKTIILSEEAKLLLNLIKEYEDLNKKQTEISELGAKLSREIFGIDNYHGYWMHATKDGILKNEAEKQLPEKLKSFNKDAYPYISDIKDKLIVANIDGNVENIIENIVAEYND